MLTLLLAFWWQATVPVFQADGNLVPIAVQVTDRASGQPLAGLSREDFLVLDDEQPTAVVALDRGEGPLDIVLIVDEHAAIIGEGIDYGIGAVRTVLRPDDRVAVMRNHPGEPKRYSDWISDPDTLTQAIGRMYRARSQYGPHSRVYDAVQAAATFINGSTGLRRPVIVAVTHNRERGSRTTRDQLIDTLLQHGIRLEAISIPQYQNGRMKFWSTFGTGPWNPTKAPPPPPQPVLLPDLRSLEPVAAATGGQVVRFHYRSARRVPLGQPTGRTWDADEMARVWEERVTSRLRQTYTLSIRGAATPQRQFRHLSVQLTDAARLRFPTAEVRARSGYFTVPAR